MGRSPGSGSTRNRRTIGLIVAWAAILVISGGWASLGAGTSRAPAHDTSSAGGLLRTGAQQTQAAAASLARGAGPAAGHPYTPPVQSPGGYTWTNISGLLSDAPSGRLTTMTWDASDGYVLLFGWEDLSGYQRDTWTYANGNWTNITGSVGVPPPIAAFSLMAYDPSGQVVIMYSPVNNSTWTYHDDVWTNITSTAGQPPEVIEASMTTDTADHEVVLVGGVVVWRHEVPNTDTWTFANGTWTNDTSSAPFSFGRIIIPVAADDPTDHGVVAQGLSEWHNSTPYLYKPATFVFSGNHWTNLTPSLATEPSMGELFGFVWLGSIGADVMELPLVINSTGGIASRTGVTWEFAHDVWTNVTSVTGPQPDTGIITTAAADPADGTIVMFGGERIVSPIVYPGTWLFSAPPSVSASVSKTVIDAGQSVTFTGTSTGGASPTTYRWNFGDGSNATSLSGSHTYSRTGVITATLTATDLVGHTSSAAASLFVNPALAVAANATPASPVNGSWVAFSSTVTGGSAPFTYSWNLGDGTTSTAASLGHAYGRTGTFSVTLNVTDAAGVSQSASFSVTVQAAPSTSTSSNSVSVTSGTGLYLLVGIVVLLAVVILLAAMLARRPKTPPGTLQPYSSTSPTPPAGATAPPGAGGPPPP